MELKTTTDIQCFLRMYVASAALSAALEFRLFWCLTDKPISAEHIAEDLSIPLYRCRCWLDLLVGLGLLERQDKFYINSSVTQTAIIEAYTPETWVFLAGDSRDRYPIGNDLIQNISHPDSVWVAQRLMAPGYVDQMFNDPKRAHRFTHMLYEIHGSLAEKLAETLDLSGVKQMMDLGGGSGIMSISLLHRHSNLTSVVVDIENVCKAGMAIAAQTSVAERITYHAADFVHNEIPMGFDLILECDVGIYTKDLFRKLRSALNPNGHLVIVDWLRQSEHEPTFQYRIDAFISALSGRKSQSITVAGLRDLLVQSGFQQVSELNIEDPIIHEVKGIVGPAILVAQK